MFRKYCFVRMVNKLKIGGKYPKGCWYFDPLHEYEDLKEVYLIYIWEFNSWNNGLVKLSLFTLNTAEPLYSGYPI